jgi:hypothetical protein
MKFHKSLLLTIFIFFFSCNEESKFPKVKELSEFEKTEFIPTLEHKVKKDKNFIYCATFIFAWKELTKSFNSIEFPNGNTDIVLLNKSNSFKNVLKKDEYKISQEVDGDFVKIRAEFNKSLPFEIKLQSFKDKLTFNGEKVSSFGVKGYDSNEQLKTVKIIYYKNDNNFIIKLLPKDKEHEIILFKTEQGFNSIAEMTLEIEKLTEIGKVEIKNEKINWKYYYDVEDIVIIPKFSFNIQTNYKTIEGTSFVADGEYYDIIKAWQRTAFILDESGAEIESEAEIAYVTEEIEEEYEKPKPKKMVFDKPFLILLKRTDATNPYFGLWTTNTELMIKE